MRYVSNIFFKWMRSCSFSLHERTRTFVPLGRSYIIIETEMQCNEQLKNYEYVIITRRVLYEVDILSFFENLRQVMHPDARLVICTSSSWVVTLQKIAAKLTATTTCFLKPRDLEHFLKLAQFELITQQQIFMVPFYLPVISKIVTLCGQLPLINRFGTTQYKVARCGPKKLQDYSVSVIIPCKNEKGTIEALVQEVPHMGCTTELIFVEGHSDDGTYEEILRVQQRYSTKNIHIFRQDNHGKKDAVLKGLRHASGQVLMILDGDLSIEPQVLAQCYRMLAQGVGEFINGSRLVYNVEKGAMPHSAYFANKGIACCLSWLFNQHIKDALCGTKVFFKKDYEKIRATAHEFPDFDPFGDFDLLFGAAYHNLKIIDIPLRYKSRRYGSSQIARYRQVWYLIAMGIVGIKKFKLKSL